MNDNPDANPKTELAANPKKTEVAIAWGMATLMSGVAFVAIEAMGGALDKAPDIGCKFDTRKEANERRELGVLDEKRVIEACAKAVKNYLEKGQTDAVVIYLPPRERIAKSKQTAQPVTPSP
jgi:ABC-type molybdate transport system substrate-binding protein